MILNSTACSVTLICFKMSVTLSFWTHASFNPCSLTIILKMDLPFLSNPKRMSVCIQALQSLGFGLCSQWKDTLQTFLSQFKSPYTTVQEQSVGHCPV